MPDPNVNAVPKQRQREKAEPNRRHQKITQLFVWPTEYISERDKTKKYNNKTEKPITELIHS